MRIVDDTEVGACLCACRSEAVDMVVFLCLQYLHAIAVLELDAVCTDAVVVGGGRFQTRESYLHSLIADIRYAESSALHLLSVAEVGLLAVGDVTVGQGTDGKRDADGRLGIVLQHGCRGDERRWCCFSLGFGFSFGMGQGRGCCLHHAACSCGRCQQGCVLDEFSSFHEGLVGWTRVD